MDFIGCLDLFDMLTNLEKKEIMKYQRIYFSGTEKSKISRLREPALSVLGGKQNNGYDFKGGFYRIIEGDHIKFRYEIYNELGRGAFGQVLMCLDHKMETTVAVKINRNSSFDKSNSRIEVRMLQKIKEAKVDYVRGRNFVI